MSIIKWQEGRQKGGYLKFKLLESKRFMFDIYILKFPVGSVVPPHTDPPKKGYRHFRLNIILKKAIEGGRFFMMSKKKVFKAKFFGRIWFFRPDVYMHRVTKIKKGTRYVLSIGFLRK